MAGRIAPAKDGFSIRGIQPPALRGADDATRTAFWAVVVREALVEKDRELARGLDKDGKPLRRISAATRKHRRSAMTPTGKGDPSAPPLTPGRALSRTRSLLAGRAYPGRATLFWRYDPFTYDSWAAVLRAQKDQGRDVFGLSPEGLARVTARSWHAFARRRRDPLAPVLPAIQPAAAPARPVPRVGTTRMDWAEAGMGARPHKPGAATTGGLPWEGWLKFLRGSAPPSTTPAATRTRRRPMNVLLSLIFGR